MSSMLIHVNEEILVEILKRIPPKLLVKFRCVSKSWNSLITNAFFISVHTKYTLENATSTSGSASSSSSSSSSCAAAKFLLRRYSWINKKEIYTIHGSSSFGQCYQELGFPFKSYAQYFEIVGCCNGILCLSDTYRVNSHTIILWNPTIRKSVTLPLPCLSSADQIYMFVLGFGFNAKNKDHKVVRIVYHMRDHGCKVDIIPQVEVYELRLDAWRSISLSIVPKYVISELSLQVFLNGSVHWIGYNPGQAGCDFCDLGIILFDMNREMFDEMKVPDSLCGFSVLDLSIFASGELLSLVQYNRQTRSQWIRYGSCSIWVMKEYGKVESWTKRFTVDLQAGIGKSLGLGNNGQILLVASNGELVSYDSQTQGISHLGIKGIANSFHLEVYIETLELLNINKQKPDNRPLC